MFYGFAQRNRFRKPDASLLKQSAAFLYPPYIVPQSILTATEKRIFDDRTVVAASCVL